MIKTTAVNLVNPEPMMVTWDVGRRCNYDCSYCESSRHDNSSPLHSLDEFIKTFRFIKDWTDLYNSQRKFKSQTNINFTGGEPTVNNNLYKLVDYIKQEDQSFNLSLTTNAAWNTRFTNKILDNFSGVTVSYHAEAHESLKKTAIENIKELHKHNIWLQVNVMLHMDYWNECVEVYKMLKDEGVKVNPRPIGDGNVARTGWFIDADGTQRRTSHPYTKQQQEWFWNEMGIGSAAANQQEGTNLGRACCGGRCLQGKVDNKWQEIKLINTEFKDWHCMVDWYFLHIDQHTGLVYHHQTCQALHDKKRGPIGNLDNTNQMIDELKTRMLSPTPIICPNQRCGCGMCIPKAKTLDDFSVLWENR
jgi:MoaA/NifB/PqqE/SkfB family radical SAM enzyme